MKILYRYFASIGAVSIPSDQELDKDSVTVANFMKICAIIDGTNQQVPSSKKKNIEQALYSREELHSFVHAHDSCQSEDRKSLLGLLILQW